MPVRGLEHFHTVDKFAEWLDLSGEELGEAVSRLRRERTKLVGERNQRLDGATGKRKIDEDEGKVGVNIKKMPGLLPSMDQSYSHFRSSNHVQLPIASQSNLSAFSSPITQASTSSTVASSTPVPMVDKQGLRPTVWVEDEAKDGLGKHEEANEGEQELLRIAGHVDEKSS